MKIDYTFTQMINALRWQYFLICCLTGKEMLLVKT